MRAALKGPLSPVAISIAAGLCAAVIITRAGRPVLPDVAAALLILVLPGYATAALVHPYADLVARVLLSCGLSVAFAVSVGIGISLLPGGAQRDVWALVLAAMAAAASSVDYIGSRPPKRAGAKRRGIRRARTAAVALAAAGAIALASVAIAIAAHSSLWQTGPGFTALSITRATPNRFIVEVQDRDRHSSEYRLSVRQDSGGSLVRSFRLRDSQTYQATIPVVGTGRVWGYLYAGSSAQPSWVVSSSPPDPPPLLPPKDLAQTLGVARLPNVPPNSGPARRRPGRRRPITRVSRRRAVARRP